MNQTAVTGETGALLSIVERFAAARIWVIGDLMLDEYLSGAVERISPEAPVPVVRVRDAELRLGGAANGPTGSDLYANDLLPTIIVLSVKQGRRQ